MQEIKGELNSRKQEEAKRRRDVQEIREQVTALQLELNSLDETVDYQVSFLVCCCPFLTSLSPLPVGEVGDIATGSSVHKYVCTAFTVYTITLKILER